MKLDYWEGWYRFECPDEMANLPRNSGFFRDKRGFWLTRDVIAARRLAHYGTKQAQEVLDFDYKDGIRCIENSFAISADGFEVPAPPGLKYLPYQKAGIAYLQEKKGGLLADEMGLGKTIQAIGLMNCLKITSALIVCPASLKLNWREELRKWLTLTLSVGIATPKFWPLSDIVIINYDLLKKCSKAIHKRDWDILIGDEVHYVKNKETARAKEFYKIPHKYSLGLTGTPVPNRSLELFPVINWLAPSHFASYRAFKQRYSGGGNSGELFQRLRSSVMVRRLKKDVLKDLPAKIRQIIELPYLGNEEVIEAELQEYMARMERITKLKEAVALAKSLNDKEEHKRAVQKLREEAFVVFTEMSRVRQQTAVAKIPYAKEHLEDCIDANNKVICFAFHKEVMDKLENYFGYRCVKIHGGTKENDRHDAVNAFQNDDSIQLFIGSFVAAGTGLTLTASAHVVFIEHDWRPYVISQAEDRAHRIGQKESVLIQHLVFEKSLDAKMMKRTVRKQEEADRVLDGS